MFRCFLLYFSRVTCDNQVARDSELLATAQDCFYFVTKFFELIDASATHIYHSALELCPISSIVRKLYYDRCHGVTRYPRVVIGNPDSWDIAVSISGQRDYESCAWSPCGQFIAAQTEETVEIRNHLTLELLNVLQSNKHTPLSTSPLAYSPDGRSLACGFSGGIVIWDIQTGGVANEIRCSKHITSLTWSLDGSMVAVTLSSGSLITDVEAYNIFSGARLFKKQFGSGVKIYLWAHEKSFRLIHTSLYSLRKVNNVSVNNVLTFTISEIGPTLIEIKSTTSNITVGIMSEIALSPSTHHLAILHNTGIHIYDIGAIAKHLLLEEVLSPTHLQFSPDGSHFALLRMDGLYVFQRTSSHYAPLWGSLFRHQGQSCLRFSPTSSSILCQHGRILQVRPLSIPPVASKSRRQSTAISRSGRRIATAHQYENTVSIIDVHSQAPPQFIDTYLGVYVERLAITGNVLVVMGVRGAAGWLLTEEGTVDGVSGDQRASDSHSKWRLTPQLDRCTWNLRVEGKVGVIQGEGSAQEPLFYHIETGDVLELAPEPENSSLKTSAETSTGGGLHYHLAAPLYLTALYR